MSAGYRNFTLPSGEWQQWDTEDWVRWSTDVGLVSPIDGGATPLCGLCYGPVANGPDGTPYRLCFQCNSYVRHDLAGLVPIAFSHRQGLEAALHRYKDFDGWRWLGHPMCSILREFLDRHEQCLVNAFGPIDLFTVVPSESTVSRGFDHMKQLVQSTSGWDAAHPWDLDLLVHLPDRTIRKQHPDYGAFLLAPGRQVGGLTIGLVDDTFTSGATLASAAAPLTSAGARVVGITLGRQLNTNYGPSRPVIDHCSRQTFDIDRCVLE